MIKLTNVNKIYGKGENAVHALKDINLELPTGKFISIVGKSGSGKSTLMNIIGALDSCTGGEVEIDGDVLNNKNANQLADYRNRKIGYIFQSFYLEPTFTVLENVAMPMTIAGIKRKEREEKALSAIKSLNLEDKVKKKASELSGGQKQRVSIARALVFDPDIILADEPTGNLDSQNGQEVIALLQQICDQGKTVLLVTHNIDDARKTDIMVEIKDGVIANITHNDEQTKKAAQHESDYDAEGNLKTADDKEQTKLPADGKEQTALQADENDVNAAGHSVVASDISKSAPDQSAQISAEEPVAVTILPKAETAAKSVAQMTATAPPKPAPQVVGAPPKPAPQVVGAPPKPPVQKVIGSVPQTAAKKVTGSAPKSAPKVVGAPPKPATKPVGTSQKTATQKVTSPMPKPITQKVIGQVPKQAPKVVGVPPKPAAKKAQPKSGVASANNKKEGN